MFLLISECVFTRGNAHNRIRLASFVNTSKLELLNMLKYLCSRYQHLTLTLYAETFCVSVQWHKFMRLHSGTLAKWIRPGDIRPWIGPAIPSLLLTASRHKASRLVALTK